MAATYGVDDYIADLRRITAETSDQSEIFERLGPLVQTLVADTSWVKPEFYEADPEQGSADRVGGAEGIRTPDPLTASQEQGVPPGPG